MVKDLKTVLFEKTQALIVMAFEISSDDKYRDKFSYLHDRLLDKYGVLTDVVVNAGLSGEFAAWCKANPPKDKKPFTHYLEQWPGIDTAKILS